MSTSQLNAPIESTQLPDSKSISSNNEIEDVHVSGVPAVITWIENEESTATLHHLSHSTHDHLTLHIHHNVHSNTAFFQLRANIALKTRRDRTNVFLSIPPETIRKIELVEDDEGKEVATAQLASNTHCLQFNLNGPPVLVVPKGDLTPKHKASRVVLDSLRALNRQTVLSVHLPSTTLAKTHLVALCQTVSSGSLGSIEKFTDIASLYGGKGGRIVEHEPPNAAIPYSALGSTTTDENSPPSYDELTFAPSSLQPLPAQKLGNKRRRTDSDSGSAPTSRSHQCVNVNVENLCQKMMERIEDGFNEIGSRLDRMEQRLTTLETRVENHADKLGVSIQQVYHRSSEQVEELRNEIDTGLYDVRRETEDIITVRVEDEMYVARDQLEDHVKDEMANVEERLEEKLQESLTSANVSLEFSWNR